ncbi:MAG: efflux RND transporter periplasmic adaptor subunit [Psittacicella sp.]
MESKKKSFLGSTLFKLILLVFIIVILAIIGFQYFISSMKAKYLSHMPVSINVVKVQKLEPSIWNNYIISTGFLTPVKGASLSTEESGRIISIPVKSGEVVKQGQLIMQLNDSVQKADLAAAKANLISAKSTYESDAKLYKESAVSLNTYDKSLAAYQYDLSQIKLLESTINLYTIKAPFAGKLGVINYNVGQFVNSNTEIVNLESSNMMKIIFTVPQSQISSVALNDKVLVTVSSSNKTYEGKVSAIGNKVSSSTGLVDIEAILPNNQDNLFSGMFGNVSLVLPSYTNQKVLPNVAITYTLYGNTIYYLTPITNEIAKKDNLKITKGEKLYVAHQLIVNVLNNRQISALISNDKLQFGDLVVTSGQENLENNSIVKILPGVAVGASIPKIQTRL